MGFFYISFCQVFPDPFIYLFLPSFFILSHIAVAGLGNFDKGGGNLKEGVRISERGENQIKELRILWKSEKTDGKENKQRHSRGGNYVKYFIINQLSV